VRASVRISQLIAQGLNAEFPALRLVVTTDYVPRLGEMFGRDSDIEQVAGMLSEHRLVTVTGGSATPPSPLPSPPRWSIRSPTGDGWSKPTDLAPTAGWEHGSDHESIEERRVSTMAALRLAIRLQRLQPGNALDGMDNRLLSPPSLLSRK
jgi:hypothetical protein